MLFKNQDDCCNYEWTDGYKVVNQDMTAPFTGFQYKVGEVYVCNVLPKAGNSGFHFYKYLKHAVGNFPIEKCEYKYFKVRAFYDPKNYEGLNGFSVGIAYTSKKILLLEEVHFNEIMPYLPKFIQDIVQNEEEYATFNNYGDYRNFAIEKCVNMLRGRYADDYSRSVITMLFDRKRLSMDKIKYMIALRDQGVSIDNIAQIVNGFFNG